MMRHRQVLLKIRENRDLELDGYKKLIAKIENPESEYSKSQIEKRRVLLALELPFQIGSVSVNEARIKEKNKNFSNENISLETWEDKVCGDMEGSDVLQAKHKKSFVVNLMNNILWPKAVYLSYDSKKGKWSQSSPKNVPFEDLCCSACQEELLKNFTKLSNGKLSNKTKSVYSSYINKPISFSKKAKGFETLPAIAFSSVGSSASSEELATYFEYLEQCCLSGWSDAPYYNLIAARLIFYVALPFKDLSVLTPSHFTKNLNGILYNGQSFPVSKSFAELACSFISKKSSFLQRDAKSLNKFVGQSSVAARLKQPLNPKMIKNSMAALCRREGYPVQELPSR